MEEKKVLRKEVKKTVAKKEIKKVSKKPIVIKKEVKKTVPRAKQIAETAYDKRPVIGNPRGKYNLKFIDWQNEWEAVCEYMHNPDAAENPCLIDERDFEEIVVLSHLP
eukprot:TRINITY_DN4902_c0_g3_i1.p1 TRINITY_DN4902_c0_g3~~TRINITY_DN4902_c0_g3_i1.p1  ORF type:complete len:108 (+),score=36.84 TRINITY_DN4902_c0_g3_i1:145-468(+)